jgi:hypothetical protein
MDGDLDIDMSWIKEYSRIHSIQQIMNREELDSIVIQTIYMDTNLKITKIDKEPIKLTTSNRNTNNKIYISKEQLLRIIKTKKVIEKTKYTLFDMLLFTVDLDPKDIQKYVNGECKETAKLKSIPIIDDIVVLPSIFIFHSLHTFFLFFVEVEHGSFTKDTGGNLLSQDNGANIPITSTGYSRGNFRLQPISGTADSRSPYNIPVKSILKSSDNKKPKQTKKVRIFEGDNLVIPRPVHKKTRKVWNES